MEKILLFYFQLTEILLSLYSQTVTIKTMKSKELHRFILSNGWRVVRQSGSHIIYEKDGRRYPVPLHGSKEVPTGMELKIKREMGLK